MFSTKILHRLRPCVFSQPFGSLHTMAVRYKPLTAVSYLRAASGKQFKFHAHRGLFIKPNDKVQSHCLSTRYFSTSSHSEDGSLIYTGNLGTAVRGVKFFCYSSTGASLLLMPHILLNTGLGTQSFAMQAACCGIIGILTFLYPVLLHILTKGYVVRLYHNADRDTYTAITYSVLLTEKRSVFHQTQVSIPGVSKMFTTFYADKFGLLVNPDQFPNPQDYNHLMGYDKPFNFETDTKTRPDKS